ncbi:hypothetical protein LG329_05785 [Virgibacillus necropolis]|uniref:hypothetical protein n=1 Tax=Virgibacillus necropolis TaxID=163877 RepID=UPI00384B4002
MSEERFERIEDMLSQLIGMVAKTYKRMDTSMEDFRLEMKAMRTENDQRHQEIIQKSKDLEADQNYTWGKITRNEREITKLKEQQLGT